jgi:hypothetical protein
MPWKRTLKTRVNTSLRRVTGYELRPASPQPKASAAPRKKRVYELAPMPPEERLVKAPVFILGSIRSGSTLLRVLLGSHSELYAPHELHLSNLEVHLRTSNTHKSMAAIGLDQAGLEHLLWDRLLDRQLRMSRKKILVNKTPSDAFIWQRIVACWPDARFIFLLRHPLSIARSRQAAHPHEPLERHVARTATFMNAVEEARQSLPGPTVRYEQLTADPEGVTRELCEFIGVEWEPSMLDYGSNAGGDFRMGLGDWSEQIKSGAIQPARPLPKPEEVPEALKGLCRAWGYLPADS